MFEYFKELGLPKQVAAILGIVALVSLASWKWAEEKHEELSAEAAVKVQYLERRQNSYELKALQRQAREIKQEQRNITRMPLPEAEKRKDIDNLQADLDAVVDDIGYYQQQQTY